MLSRKEANAIRDEARSAGHTATVRKVTGEDHFYIFIHTAERVFEVWNQREAEDYRLAVEIPVTTPAPNLSSYKYAHNFAVQDHRCETCNAVTPHLMSLLSKNKDYTRTLRTKTCDACGTTTEAPVTPALLPLPSPVEVTIAVEGENRSEVYRGTVEAIDQNGGRYLVSIWAGVPAKWYAAGQVQAAAASNV